MLQITSLEELEQFIEENKDKPLIIFKHSHRCPISAMAFKEFEQYLFENPQIKSAWVDVVYHRDVSDKIVELYQVCHESPQALIIKEGIVEQDASHSSITVDFFKKYL